MFMPLTAVSTPNAPSAVGPYSQAMKAGNLVFVSACGPFIPDTMEVIEGDIEAQAKQALANMKAIVDASGSSLDRIAKVTIFLRDMDQFQRTNAVYAEFFGSHKPARSCIEASKLPLDVLFAADCIAVTDRQ